MKKILILAYDFPPYVSVGGLRPYAWYKYFHEFGLYPVVVTRQWGNKYGNHLDYIAPGESNETIIEESEIGTIIRTPYKPNLANRLLLKYGENKFRLLRKAISGFYEFTQFLLPVGTKVGLYKGTRTYLKQHKVDAIIATGEPFILFKYAHKLSKKHNIPWIADYRDPWTQNEQRSSNALSKYRNRFFEKKCLKNVNFITTVSPILENQIKSLIKDKPIHIIPNGYSLSNELELFLPNSKALSIAFAGTIYPWHPWESVLKIIANLITENKLNIEISFYGVNNSKDIQDKIEENYLEIANNIHLHSKLPNEKLLQKLSKNHLLLLFNDYSIAGTKIYDYLAVKRKILLCYTNDKESLKLKSKHFPIINNGNFSNELQKDIIEYTQSGYVIKDEQMLLKTIQNLYQELQETGKIQCDSVNIEQFSRKHQVKKLAEIIKNTLQKFTN